MGGEVSADAEQPELQKGSARVFDIITGIFSAIIPALVAGGIVKGILAAIAAFGIDTGAGDFAIFNMISDIPFYFLPFCWQCLQLISSESTVRLRFVSPDR